MSTCTQLGCGAVLTAWQRRPGNHRCNQPALVVDVTKRRLCVRCNTWLSNPSALSRHQQQPCGAAAAAAAAAPVDDDDDDVMLPGGEATPPASPPLLPAAAVAPPPPPPPPPPLPLPAAAAPPAPSPLQQHRTFLAAWALHNHITATALDQLLREQSGLFRDLAVVDPPPPPAASAAAHAVAASASPAAAAAAAARSRAWPTKTEKLIDSVIGDDSLSLVYYALCPHPDCGSMVRLGDSGKLSQGQTCTRPVMDITERPKAMDDKAKADKAAAAAATEAKRKKAEEEERTAAAASSSQVAESAAAADGPRRSTRKKGAAAASASAAAASAAPRAVVVCGTVLTGTVLSEDRRSTRPRLVFTYRPLALSLAQLLQRPGLEKKCELWRQRYDPVTHKRKQTDLLSDIWDGEMWERYQHTPMDLMGPPPPAPPPPPPAAAEAPVRMDIDGEEKQEAAAPALAAAAAAPPAALPLLSQSGTLALGFNLDWYQPFDSQVYSMGGLYMVILNLPREERYLTENMIQVGILPGPGETPRRQLQGALKKLRDELLQLYAAGGVPMKTADHPDGRPVRAFLLHVVCDIPAARILCGFARETSAWGCPYCAQRQLKRKGCPHADWRPWTRPCEKGRRKQLEVEDFEERARFPRRTHQQHVEHARAWSKASVGAADSASSIETAQVKAFKEHGARWSWLLDLPYWDSIRCMPIDVMHNILLGTCKHIMALMTGKRLKKAEWAAAADDPAPAPAAAAAAAAGGRKKRSKNKDRKKRSKKKGRAAAESEVEDNSEDGTTDDESSSASSDESAGSEGTFAVDQPAQPSGPDYSDDSSAHDSDDPYVVGAVHVSDEAKDAGADDEECKETDSRKRKTKRSSPARNAARKKRQRKHKARRSFNVNNPGASEIILSKSDLSKIQGMLDRSHCPRDIGRIPHKLESLSQIKASEWMNFFGIFAVPMIRELMRDGHERLTVEHLEIFILMQLIVAKLREYAITEEDIETLHKRLFKVTQLVAAAFPGDEGSVSPNMHLSLHLRQQLLDYGVAASCWTDPYERFNGLLSRLPLNLAMPAYSTARRTCKLVAVAGAEAAAAFGQPLPDRRDYFEAPNRPDDCKLTRVGGKVQYEWTDVQSYLLHVQRRQGRTAGGVVNVKGDEPFAGELRCRTSRPFRLTGITAAQSAGAPCLQFPQRRRRTEVQTLLVRVSHLLVCLQVHYLETRKEDILALVDADDTLSGEEQTAEKESLQDTTSLSNRQKALKNRYVLQYFGTLDPEVRMYDTLVMGSETYGSAGGRNRNSSYVAVAFPTGRRADGTDSTKMWYGQVSYYICHKYNHIPHFFAVCRWFLWQGQQSKDMEDSTAMDLFFKPLGPLVGQSSLVKKSFRSFPILTPGNNDADFNPAHADDIVPVQRIAHRWIPTKHRDTAGKEFHLVGSIPTRLHA